MGARYYEIKYGLSENRVNLLRRLAEKKLCSVYWENAVTEGQTTLLQQSKIQYKPGYGIPLSEKERACFEELYEELTHMKLAASQKNAADILDFVWEKCGGNIAPLLEKMTPEEKCTLADSPLIFEMVKILWENATTATQDKVFAMLKEMLTNQKQGLTLLSALQAGQDAAAADHARIEAKVDQHKEQTKENRKAERTEHEKFAVKQSLTNDAVNRRNRKPERKKMTRERAARIFVDVKSEYLLQRTDSMPSVDQEKALANAQRMLTRWNSAYDEGGKAAARLPYLYRKYQFMPEEELRACFLWYLDNKKISKTQYFDDKDYKAGQDNEEENEDEDENRTGGGAQMTQTDRL